MVHVRFTLASALATSLAATLLTAVPAGAQPIDRAALEDLFGEPITTSATGAPQRASDAPAAMIIISGDELRQTGVQNLAEALRGRAGIDVMQVSANDYEVAVRGGNQPLNPRLLVMVDGRQVYLDHYGLTSWTNLGIELAEIRQIEIVKGPVSALFGFNAASGAINIITFDPASERRTTLSAEAGNDGQYGVSGVGTVKLGERAGLRLSAGYAEQDEYFGPDGRVGRGKPYRGNVAADLSGQLGEKVSARLSYSYSDSRQSVLVPGFTPLDMIYRVHSAHGEISADTSAGLLSVSGQYNKLTNHADPLTSIGDDTSFDTNLFVLRVQDILKAGPRDTIRITAEYRSDMMRVTPNLAGKISYRIASGGMMWDHRFGDGVSLNLAGRIDHLGLGQDGALSPDVSFTHADFDRDRTLWSANAGLIVKPDGASTIRLQAARGLQAPSLVSSGMSFVTTVMPGLDIRIMGNPDIEPTVTDSVELGYSHDVAATGGRFTSTIFYSNTHRVAGFADLPPVMRATGMLVGETFVNAGSYRSFGLEAALDGALGEAVKWRLDYTFNRIVERFGTQAEEDSPYAELTPRHKIGAGLSYAKGAFSADLRTYLRSHVHMPLAHRDSGWTGRVDARIGYKLSPLVELYAVGENLTDTAFVDNDYVRLAARGRIGLRIGR